MQYVRNKGALLWPLLKDIKYVSHDITCSADGWCVFRVDVEGVETGTGNRVTTSITECGKCQLDQVKRRGKTGFKSFSQKYRVCQHSGRCKGLGKADKVKRKRARDALHEQRRAPRQRVKREQKPGIKQKVSDIASRAEEVGALGGDEAGDESGEEYDLDEQGNVVPPPHVAAAAAPPAGVGQKRGLAEAFIEV